MFYIFFCPSSFITVTVREVFTLAFRTSKFGLSGAGYSANSGKLFIDNSNDTLGKGDTDGSSSFSNRTITRDSNEFVALEALFHTGCLCNNATIPDSYLASSLVDKSASVIGTTGSTAPVLSGQPTELAILVASHKAQLGDTRTQYERVHEIPFSSERKFMEVQAYPINASHQHVCAAFVEAANDDDDNKNCMTFLKGMPENVIKECTTYCLPDGTIGQLSDDDKQYVLAEARKMASNALRVIAFAYGRTCTSTDNNNADEQQHQLTFAGLMGMEDPPRVGVRNCVLNLRRGGVNVLMITGDSKETAFAIAKRCGIVDTIDDDDDDAPTTTPSIEIGDNGISCMSGTEIDTLDPTTLTGTIRHVKVFYRVSPRHKLAIVRARKYSFF
jgi:P-type Ca2+ transporter type 2C